MRALASMDGDRTTGQTCDDASKPMPALAQGHGRQRRRAKEPESSHACTRAIAGFHEQAPSLRMQPCCMAMACNGAAMRQGVVTGSTADSDDASSTAQRLVNHRGVPP